jgi:hypothetical protein
MTKRIIGMAVISLLLLYFITLILHISANHDTYMWDFRTHREAAGILASGADPYDPDILFPNADTRFLYTYPPVTLYFFRLFSMVDYETAFHTFLILKCILLIGLIYFWKREFLKEDADILFYVFCLLAFNSAVFLDMIAGNINLFEEVMLWLAFHFYLKNKLRLFCAGILVAASFKMIPIFFLILLLLSGEKKKYTYLFGSGAIFLAYLFIQYIIAPDLFADFLRNAQIVVGEPGGVVPSTYKMIGDLFQLIANATGIAVPQGIQLAVVSAIAAAILLLSYKAWIRLKSIEIEDKAMMEVFLACLIYALIHPRFKDYMYILLLLPSYYLIKNLHHTAVTPFLYILFILSCNRMVLPIVSSLYEFIWSYYPLMVAYCVWGLFLHHIFAAAQNPNLQASPRRK